MGKAVEDADFENTNDLFADVAGHGERQVLHGRVSFEEANPRNEQEFMEFAKSVAEKLTQFESHYFYVDFVKALVKKTVAGVKADDIKSLSKDLNLEYNERLKKERDLKRGGKKKQSNKKAQVAVAK